MFRTYREREIAINEQVDWIIEHGEDEAGYVMNYGSMNDAVHYGDGGEAIYAADIAAYNKIIRMPVREKGPNNRPFHRV